MVQFNPDHDIPDLSQKTILITGGTAGLGEGSIKELSKHNPDHVIFTGRNQARADAIIEHLHATAPNVKATFITCDISSLISVRQAAAKVNELVERLDIVMLNAGIMAVAPAVSKDGFETQFATNYLGHALLIKLLLPRLLETARLPNADVRIINMTSIAYKQAPSQGIDFATLKSSQASLGGAIPGGKWSRYGQSKLAQLLYTDELARHHPELTAISIHPGYIMTGLFDGPSFATLLPVMIMSLGRRTPVEKGHYAQCWAASAPKSSLKNGAYYEPIGKLGQRSTSASRDRKLAEELWTWTEKELSVF